MNIDPWTRLHFACAMYAKCIQMMYTKYIHIYTNITILTAVDLEKGLCKQITNCASRAIKKKVPGITAVDHGLRIYIRKLPLKL